jgi:peptide/nickel transport system permease protein
MHLSGTSIADPVKNSLILALVTALFMIPLSLALGALSAVLRRKTNRPRHLDRSTRGHRPARVRDRVSAIGVFFVWLDVLPPSPSSPGDDPLHHSDKLILPVATLLLASLAASIRMVRAG